MMEQYLSSIGGMMFLRKFDLFSQPFIHRVDYNQKTKKTSLGGFISLVVMVLSLLYLIYILYLFFSGSYSPIITSQYVSQDGLITYDLDFSPFAFTFRKNNAVYTNWQTYFDVEMYLDNDGTDTSNQFKIVQCKDVLPDYTTIKEHFCIDTNSTPTITLKTNQADPADDKLFTFALRRKKGCTSTSSCFADPLLQTSNFVLELVFIYERYDTDSKQLKKVISRESVILDPNLYVRDLYTVTQTSAKIDEGFIVQSVQNQSFISDFKKSQSVVTNTFMQLKMSGLSNSSDLLKMTQIQLTDSIISLSIEYAKISIVLAQFQSIFSTLLILGILAKLGSENKTVEENIDILMNNYYKQSAIEIDKYLDSQKQSKDSAAGLANGSNQILPVKLGNVEDVKERFETKNKLFNLYSFKLIKHLYTDGNKISEDDDDIQLRSFKKVLKKSWSVMNVHQMHLEILRSKTALQMLLSEKQYASLDFISRRLYPGEDDKNHLEKLEQIEDNNDLRIKKAIEYFQELNSKDNLADPIDQKFKNSFIKSVFSPEKKDIITQDEELQGLNPITQNSKMIMTPVIKPAQSDYHEE